MTCLNIFPHDQLSYLFLIDHCLFLSVYNLLQIHWIGFYLLFTGKTIV